MNNSVTHLSTSLQSPVSSSDPPHPFVTSTHSCTKTHNGPGITRELRVIKKEELRKVHMHMPHNVIEMGIYCNLHFPMLLLSKWTVHSAHFPHFFLPSSFSPHRCLVPMNKPSSSGIPRRHCPPKPHRSVLTTCLPSSYCPQHTHTIVPGPKCRESSGEVRSFREFWSSKLTWSFGVSAFLSFPRCDTALLFVHFPLCYTHGHMSDLLFPDNGSHTRQVLL